LIRCLFYGKQEKINSFNVNWFVLADILLANGDELNLLLPKFARPLYFFSSSALALPQYVYFLEPIFWKKIVNIFVFSLQLFHGKT